MSATPGAKNEYSRGSGHSGRDSGGDLGGSEPPFGRRTLVVDRGAGGPILAGALLGALLLIVAEFTSLYQVHVATSSAPIKSVSGGSHHSYAMLLIGLAAAALGVALWRSGSRPALLGLGILGIVALLIALLGDLPDSHARGLAGSAARGYVNATSTPSAGLYMETLGGVLLIVTCGLGFMMLGTPGPRRRPRGPADGGDGDGRSGNGSAGDGRQSSDGRVGGDGGADPAWTRRRRTGN